MRKITEFASMAMVVVVLFLGAVMPTLPNLDDDDENVGCAAVIQLASRKSVESTSLSTDLHTNDARLSTLRTAVAKSRHDADQSESSTRSLAHVSPPLRT